jgi:hypothetical protein
LTAPRASGRETRRGFRLIIAALLALWVPLFPLHASPGHESGTAHPSQKDSGNTAPAQDPPKDPETPQRPAIPPPPAVPGSDAGAQAQITVPEREAPDEAEVAVSILPAFGAGSGPAGEPEVAVGTQAPAMRGEVPDMLLPAFDRTPEAAPAPPQPPQQPPPGINITPEITAPLPPPLGRPPQPPLSPAPSINITPEITAPLPPPLGQAPQPRLSPAPQIDVSPEVVIGVTPAAPPGARYSLPRPFPNLTTVNPRGREQVTPSIPETRPPRDPAEGAPAAMVLVEGGTFETGGLMSGRLVRVNSFWMAKTPVTQGEYHQITRRDPPSDPLLPAENVSWYDALEFCNRLSLKEGLKPAYDWSNGFIVWDLKATGYRLPTEAEWEYAARDTPGRGQSFWHRENSGGRSHRVGEKEPNRLGVYDLLGNVWEWCWNWYDSYRASDLEEEGHWGRGAGTEKALRGGSWNTPPDQARPAARRSADPLARYKDVGFRLVRTLF